MTNGEEEEKEEATTTLATEGLDLHPHAFHLQLPSHHRTER